MILYLQCVDNEITYNKKNYLLRAAERLGLNWVQEYKGTANPECVLNIEPYGQLVRGTKWTGIWEIDLLLSRSERSTTDWAAADDIFLAISILPEGFKSFREKCHLLFQACDPELHRRMKEVEQKYDVIICGNDGNTLIVYPMRKKYLNLIQEKYKFHAFGNGFKPKDYVANNNQAKVQFIRSMGRDDLDGEIAQRFFECLAIGPVLTNYVPRDMPHLGLIEGVDYMSYSNEKELFEKLDRLLADENLRNNIFEMGRKKAINYHTYEHRLMSIINVIKEHDIQKY